MKHICETMQDYIQARESGIQHIYLTHELWEQVMKLEVVKVPEFTHSEFGCSIPVRFFTEDGIKTMQPGKLYDENLNEI